MTSHGPIEADKENIRQEPYSLPQGFMWDTLDLSNADVVSTVFVTDAHSICLLELQLTIIFFTSENFIKIKDLPLLPSQLSLIINSCIRSAVPKYIFRDFCHQMHDWLCLFQLKELYTLLNENYVEDDENMFRFDYSPNFLKW